MAKAKLTAMSVMKGFTEVSGGLGRFVTQFTINCKCRVKKKKQQLFIPMVSENVLGV